MSFPATEHKGYINQSTIEKETSESYYRVRTAITTLNIKARTFPGDRRFKYVTDEEAERIKTWLQEHQ